MNSKADIVRQNLAGLSVLDIGGCGYGTLPWEPTLNAAFGTEIVFFCDRNAPKLKWDYM